MTKPMRVGEFDAGGLDDDSGTRTAIPQAYFPESYGDGLVRLAFEILHRRPVPPALFTRHQLLTAADVDHVYPNDRLMGFTSSGP